MRNEPIDMLIRLAWAEGWVNTRGAYEKAVLEREELSVAPERDPLVALLQEELALVQRPVPLTIGALLLEARGSGAIASAEMSSRIGVSSNMYKMMEHDAISPLKIPLDSWKRLMTLLNCTAGEMSGMIRRTHQLVFFRSSFKGVLARYDSGKNKGEKKRALENAFAEMYARADLALPLVEEGKLQRLLNGLKH